MKKKMLVVDDYPVILKYMKRLLEKEGHEVRVATDGLCAIDILETFIPEVVFIDLVMPKISGEKLCRVIRQMPQMRDACIVILSAIAAEEDFDFAAIGAHACIAKGPFDTMSKHILEVIDQSDHLRRKSDATKVLGLENIYKRNITAELLAIKKHFEAVFDHMSEGIMEFTPAGKIIMVNPAAAAMMDDSEERLLGLAFTELFDYADQKEIESYIEVAPAARPTGFGKFTVELNKRKIFLTILPAEDEEDWSFLVILQDVTEAKQAQDALQKAHKELEQRIKERTAELVASNEELKIEMQERSKTEAALRESESKLRQAQKMESIGTLAGGIAHEFNNILGIIIGNTELAIDDVPEWNPAKECLKEIRTASMRAKDVVKHILSFARKTPAQRKPTQISTIIRDSLKLMRASIPTTIEIRQNISCGSEMILADPNEINQILMNLCTNSVHALSEETGVLEVSLENEKLIIKNEELGIEPGRYVKLTVKDTGQGIDPEIMDRIFDPYFTTKDIGRGTGMGLAVAYGIVKKHDGAIQIKSTLGKGTLVEVFFPLIVETEESEIEEEPEDFPTGTERILFVDDEASLTKMVQQMLGRLGYQVVTKTNPKEALALFKAEPDKFDLVITDMAMPQMAGDRLAQELMEIRKDIPVILCTGHSARIDEDRAKELGLAAYVMKPLVKRDFANTVRQVLDAK